jgi:replicative DNA helicase
MTTAVLANVEAERAVLGAMLMSTDIAEQVADIIDPTAHYTPAHTTIHKAIVAAINAGDPVDPVSIATRLQQRGDLERVGGAVYLHDLLTTVPVAASAPWHARNLADLSIRRQIAEAGIKIHQRASDLETDTDTLIATAQNDLHHATISRDHKDATALGDNFDQFVDDLCNPAADARGLSTGIGELDDIIGGLKPGQLILVGARPSMGKTVVGVQAARATAIRAGLPALMFSLEMSENEVKMRICSSECDINMTRILNKQMTDHEKARLRDNRARLAAAPLFIDDNASHDITGMRTAARRIQQKHGLSLIVVDYIQLMTSKGSSENRVQEVSAISRGLKLLARELDVPVVAAAQLNRKNEDRADKRPQLSDLRESGSLEQDADVVILIHRDDYYDPESPRSGEVDLIVAKNRNGPKQTMTAAAQLEFVRFVDMLPEYQDYR